MHSDNLRAPSDRKLARAALRFAESMERGTALIRVPKDGGDAFAGYISTPTVGGKVLYRALAGDIWDAFIVAVRGPETVDLDVIVPGCEDRVRLTGIRWRRGGTT